MERLSPLAPDLPENWASNNGRVRNGTDAAGNPINGTPRQPNSTTYPVLPGDVTINEIAWSGSGARPGGEWIELVNNTTVPVDLSGWHLTTADGGMDIALTGVIPPDGFYLIERHDDTT